MNLGIILYVTGFVLAIGFVLAMCVRIVLDMAGFNVPSEKKFIRVFNEVALIYGIIVFIYLMGRIAK